MSKRGFEEMDQLPPRSRRAPKYLDDYILQKITRRNKLCNLDEVKKHRSNMDDLINALEDLDLDRHSTSEDDLINQLKHMDIGTMDNKVNELRSVKKARIGGQKGGAIMGMNAAGLVMYLIADALKEGAKYGYEQITQLLAGGLKVLEFLSNKNDCAELIAREMLGKQLMVIIQFFVIGTMVLEVNPMKIIIVLAELLPKLLPYVTKGISGGFISAIGYLVYHFVNHYGNALSENAKGKLNNLKNTLDALEQAKSEDVVEKVISTSKDMVNKTKEVVAELKKETPLLTEEEKMDIMEKIRKELTAIPENRTGEIEDVMTMDQLRELDITQEGGKNHKKRKTQKRKKNKSIKKSSKKTNKSRKHHK